jgi:hypothetical protein
MSHIHCISFVNCNGCHGSLTWASYVEMTQITKKEEKIKEKRRKKDISDVILFLFVNFRKE